MSGRIITIAHHGSSLDPCSCSNCDWSGPADALSGVVDADLTAGDASPAGRCPDCDCLAYLERPKDLLREHAAEFARAAAQLVWGDNDPATLQRARDLAALALGRARIDECVAHSIGLLPKSPT
jgi:hypothetical protein